jgi:hypothetical protein
MSQDGTVTRDGPSAVILDTTTPQGLIALRTVHGLGNAPTSHYKRHTHNSETTRRGYISITRNGTARYQPQYRRHDHSSQTPIQSRETLSEAVKIYRSHTLIRPRHIVPPETDSESDSDAGDSPPSSSV